MGGRAVERRAYQRSGRMAVANGLDPVEIAPEDIDALACRCAKCEFGDDCLIWHLEAADTAPGPPPYCLNRAWITERRAGLRR